MFGRFCDFCRRVREDFKARRRGEVRVAPKECVRGRVYARPGERPASGGNAVAAKRGSAATVEARIFSAHDQKWYSPAGYQERFLVRDPVTGEWAPKPEFAHLYT